MFNFHLLAIAQHYAWKSSLGFLARKILAVTFLGLAKVGLRKYQSSNLVQKLIESTNVQPSTKAPLLPNPCACCTTMLV